MSTTSRAITKEQANFLQRVKNGFGTAFFLLIHHSPKLLEIYRNEKTWTLFRVALGCFGAALVVLPLSLWNGYWTALFGMALFVLSILLPPAELESSTDRAARELGAQTVVSGGEYQAENMPPTDVQFFISPSHTYVLDRNFDPLVSISTAQITSLRVEQSWGNWVLRISWSDRRAEFTFKGIFAERFARLAEESLRQASEAARVGAHKSRAARA